MKLPKTFVPEYSEEKIEDILEDYKEEDVNTEMVYDKEFIELIELEMKYLLDKYGAD